MDVRRANRSFTDVLADILRNAQDVLRSEIRLAQSEVRDDLARARPAAMLVAAAAAGGVLSVLFGMLAVLQALRLVMPAWAAALCVAAALALAAIIALAAGLRRFRALSPAPKLRAQAKESMEWVKEQTK